MPKDRVCKAHNNLGLRMLTTESFVQVISMQAKKFMGCGLVFSILLLAATAIGCNSEEVGGGRLKVVTTVSPITSIVENIGGDRIQLEGVVPEGVNSHIFEPQPSLAKLMADADLIIANGLFLEQPTLELAEANKKEDTPILLLGDRAISREQWQFDFSFPESGGHPNPHLWPDPNLGLKYAELAQEQLANLDPDNADYYEGNLQTFRQRINDLDAAIRPVGGNHTTREPPLGGPTMTRGLISRSLTASRSSAQCSPQISPNLQCGRLPSSLTRSGNWNCRQFSAPRSSPARCWKPSPGRETLPLLTSWPTTTFPGHRETWIIPTLVWCARICES